MKKHIIFIALLALPLLALSQPQARRNQQQPQQKQSASSAVTTRAKIAFPTAPSMDEDVVWRRDLYRELNLADGANAGLYYPATAHGGQMNLFAYLFKLVLSGQVKAYEYKLDGVELFTDSARIKPMQFLKDYDIYYEKGANGRVRISDADIPSARVKRYYIKESAYYDQKSSTFHTQVLAICPILEKEDDDDWGEATVLSYPLFWVKYDDLAPFLSGKTIMVSDINNAAVITMEDFFAKSMYRGKIYKTNNMLGRTLPQYCTTDSAMAKEQARIEQELKDFENHMWSTREHSDSLDSVAKAEAKAKPRKKANNRRSGGSDAPEVKTKPGRTGGGSATRPARVSVRRERH